MDKSIRISEEDYEWLKERKKNTGASIRYIISIAIGKLKKDKTKQFVVN